MNINIDHFGFGSNVLFSNLQVSISKEDKIGITGKNGIGKSTFFNLIIGKYSSKIQITNPMNFGYFGDDAMLNPYSSLNKEIGLFKAEVDFSRYNYLVKRLNFTTYLDQSIRRLSKGNQVKAQLIFLLSNAKKELFLLDEPTEGLDEQSIDFLAEYIQKAEQAFLIISHNPLFIEKATQKSYLLKNQTFHEHVA